MRGGRNGWGVDMVKSHGASHKQSNTESPTATGYIVAIVGVVGGAFLLPPFPLLFSGIVAIALITLLILLSFLCWRCLYHLMNHRANMRSRLPHARKQTLAVDYSSQAPVPVNHAGIVSDI